MTSASDLFLDIHHHQRRKWSEFVSGDTFVSRRLEDEDRLIAVLSDGLGSGIKAHILSSMTAHMAARFVAAGTDPLRACEVMMESLPVCQVRKIAYATFSIVDCDMDGAVRIVEEGNPGFVLLRGAKAEETPVRTMASRLFPERKMRVADIRMQAEDRLIICSDGVTQSGMGTPSHPLGWREAGLREYLSDLLLQNPDISSRELSRAVVEEAMRLEPGGRPLDDTSCLALHFRPPRRLMVLTGPPYNAAEDGGCARLLAGYPGRKAVCGGTTANMVAREWGETIVLEPLSRNRALPPCGVLAGVDLVTEGILTLTQAVVRLEAGAVQGNSDAADRLIDLFFDSDAIDFLVGTRINDAHQAPNLPADLDSRRTIVRRLDKILREKYLKKTSLRFV